MARPSERWIEQELVPRVRRIQNAHGRLDLDSIADKLRQIHKEYARKPMPPFKQAVQKALENVKAKDARGSGSDDERLSKQESDYLKRKRRSGDAEGEDDSVDSVEAAIEMGDIKVETVADSNIMNTTLNATYRAQPGSSTPAPSPIASIPRPVASIAPSTPTPRTPQIAQASSSPAVAAPPTEKKDKDKDKDKSDAPKTPKLARRSSSKYASGSAESGFASSERPTMRYADMGGIENVMQEVRELIEAPLLHPELFLWLGVEPPRGILFHGPPGCGKTALASAIAGEVGTPFLRISAPEIVSGMSGESEAKIRDLFAEAASKAPAIIFIDEIDAIAPKRDNVSREMERRIVTQLLTCMDDISMEKTKGQSVIVLAATNRPDALDSALRRAGRFDREICLGIPDEAARVRILEVMTKKMKLSGDFNMRTIAKLTPGFVGADLQAVAKEAATLSIRRILSEVFPPAAGATGEMNERRAVSDALRTSGPLGAEMLAKLAINMDDFAAAVKRVQPSAKREGFTTVPDVSWSDIGALQSIRSELCQAVVDPIKFPERFKAFGKIGKSASGVLLYGPPGCGKTLLAKAVAKEAGANFISVKGPELLNKYVGETEKAIRQVFMRGKSTSPTIIFFDEFDALAPRRGSGGESNQATERVVNQLLTEMDGLDDRGDVYVIAATNRPDIIDPAMLRPGRLGKRCYVPLPTPEERSLILRTVITSTSAPIDPLLNLERLGSDARMEGFSGADLSALVREASMSCYRDTYGEPGSALAQAVVEAPVIREKHFSDAFSRVVPSVSRSASKAYEDLHRSLQASQADGVKEPRRKAPTPSALPSGDAEPMKT